jgi:hypothetical protein
MVNITDIADELAQQIPDNRDYVTFQIPASQRDAVVAKLRAATPAVGGEREALAEAVRLYENYGLLAGHRTTDALATGRWINQARAILAAQPASPLRGSGTFDAWFNNRFLDPDGGSTHLPDWLKDDLRSAWDAASASPQELAGCPLTPLYAAQPASPLRGRALLEAKLQEISADKSVRESYRLGRIEGLRIAIETLSASSPGQPAAAQCPDCGKDIADQDEPHAIDCERWADKHPSAKDTSE